MGRKKLFSLIEIAVAMAVAAIGVAAIMALLPVAVKSTSDSVGDTLATDVANAVFSKLDQEIWKEDGFKSLQGFASKKPSGTSFSQKEIDSYLNTKLDAESAQKVSSYRFDPVEGPFASGTKKGKCVFLFGSPGKKPDFAAEVLCWREDNSSLKLTSFDSSSGKARQINMNSIKYPSDTGKSGEPYVRVFIEVSWPITKPYKKGSGADTVYPRQSRLFVREYLDPAYYKPVN